jgi:glutathione S-transferase
MADTIKLGYWGIRGQGHVARLLLAYSGLKWENVAYTDHNQWFGVDKINLGFDFPNLPYLIDGDFKISESSAIHRYIANKSGKTDLLGKNIHDIAKVD